MSLIPLSNLGATPFERLIGHTPEVLSQWSQLENVFFQSETFSKHFLEQVRRTLAFESHCEYCMAKAGKPDDNIEDARLALALRFANIFAIDHKSINQNEINLLKRQFSDAEVSLLVAFCSFVSAAQRVGAALGLKAKEAYL